MFKWNPLRKKAVLRQMTFEDLKEEDLVYGVVSKIDSDEREREGRFEKVNHVFVRIAHQIDILTPLPHYFNVEVGDEVVVKINQLHSDGRARGKILIQGSNQKQEKDVIPLILFLHF